MQKIIPSLLWFNFNAPDAVNFYLSVFPDSKILHQSHYPENSPAPEGTVLAIDFELFGQRFIAVNGGPEASFTEAMSLMVACDTQEEIDRYWSKLTEDGGKGVQCGWLKDKFGIFWQITPRILMNMLRDPDKQKASRVMQAMMKMVKLDIAELERAYLN